jgi:non-ribosomal peptide synthase protein (TIGR01720 family)
MSRDEGTKERLERMPEPEIIFNYLGQFDQALDEERLFGWSDEPRGAAQGSDERRPYLLSITGSILEERLQMNWRYSANVFYRETVEQLAVAFLESLRNLIRRANTVETLTPDPMDDPNLGLSSKELEILLSRVSKVSPIGA